MWQWFRQDINRCRQSATVTLERTSRIESTCYVVSFAIGLSAEYFCARIVVALRIVAGAWYLLSVRENRLVICMQHGGVVFSGHPIIHQELAPLSDTFSNTPISRPGPTRFLESSRIPHILTGKLLLHSHWVLHKEPWSTLRNVLPRWWKRTLCSLLKL